jgi:biopolymer transport protein ExbB
MFGTILKNVTALAILLLPSLAWAQQPQARQAHQQAPVVGLPLPQSSLSTAPQAATTQDSIVPSVSPAVTSAGPVGLDNAAKMLKPNVPALQELSPWSMFLSADILVKAVMIGLAFASIVTWTIFIAKTIELSWVRRKLRSALAAIRDARSLAEAQFALRAGNGLLPMLLDAAMREAQLSTGISSDSGVKERAASNFAEISRAEARRIRLGMGLLATIGSTSPFVGLFGTVWGIMNSFIGISKAQTTNLAVVAPGIAEALLATAIGLAAAIPAVIIYNHFARVTKTYLELVARASGAAARLLSRDLDRGHGGVLARAAE